MRILIVAATQQEVVFLQEHISKFKYNNEILFHIAGVGIAPTVFNLTKYLCNDNKFDLVLNLGIAGAIDKTVAIGDVVEIISDNFYNWGAEDNGNFISVFDLGLISKNDSPFINGRLHSSFNSSYVLKKLHAITVQLVHGEENSIKKLLKEEEVNVESMEGAAVFFVSHQFNLPVMQIRSISNHVEPRNRNNWNINVAIRNLNDSAIEFLNHIESK
jgi:futalosine hydrolase